VPESLLNKGLVGIVAKATEWLWRNRGVRFGKRKLAQLLVGSSNKTAMDMGFDQCPQWGSLAFLSVRKAETLLAGLLEQGFLTTSASPKMGLTVLKVNPDWDGGMIDVASYFRPEDELDIGGVDRGLFETLSAKRREIAAESKHKDRPHWVCSDRFLIEMCLRRPRTFKEVMSIKGAPGKHSQSLLEASLEYEEQIRNDPLAAKMAELDNLMKQANLQNQLDED